MEHMWLLLPKGLRNTLNCVTWTYSSAVSGVSLNIHVWPTHVGLMRVCSLVKRGTIVSPFCLRMPFIWPADKSIDDSAWKDSNFSLLFPSRSTSWYSWTLKSTLTENHCCHSQLIETSILIIFFIQFCFLLKFVVLNKVQSDINETPLWYNVILGKIFFSQFSSFLFLV